MKFSTLCGLLVGCVVQGANGLVSESKHAKRAAQWQVGQAVQTTSGTVIGHPAAKAPQVSEYLGIPFARPPIGNLRFAAPQHYQDANATIVASTFVRFSR